MSVANSDGIGLTKPRAIFFGTPEFAVPCLLALNEIANILLVVCQPDRPAGRGMKLTPPPVKVAAQELSLAVEQPTKLRPPAFAEHLRALNADVAVVVAYGRILPNAVLSAPRLGCVNVHASLLPKYRGAAPIVWAIVHGEHETGVSLMHMDEGMDTGPELARLSVPIDPNETAGALSERLSELGATLLREALPRFLNGQLQDTPQDHAGATLAPILKKSDGAIDFAKPARAVHDHIRGMSPWPGAYTELEGKRVKLLRSSVVEEGGTRGKPGQVLRADRHGLWVACGSGVLALEELQLEGRKRSTAEQFCAGQRLPTGARFATRRS